jgi:hypothetical protein
MFRQEVALPGRSPPTHPGQSDQVEGKNSARLTPGAGVSGAGPLPFPKKEKPRPCPSTLYKRVSRSNEQRPPAKEVLPKDHRLAKL